MLTVMCLTLRSGGDEESVERLLAEGVRLLLRRRLRVEQGVQRVRRERVAGLLRHHLFLALRRSGMCRGVLGVRCRHHGGAGEQHIQRVGREGVVAGQPHDALGLGGVGLLGRIQRRRRVHHVGRVRVPGSSLHWCEGVVRVWRRGQPRSAVNRLHHVRAVACCGRMNVAVPLLGMARAGVAGGVVALYRGGPVMLLVLLEGILVTMVTVSLSRGVPRRRSSGRREVCEVHVEQVRSSCALAGGRGGPRVRPAAVAVVVALMAMVAVPRGGSNGLECLSALPATAADAAHLALALQQTHLAVLHLVEHAGQALRVLVQRE